VAPKIAAWMATTNAAWLHLSQAMQSGTGSTNVVFSYDANPGATRSGTLTIAGQTLTVTQAGSTYVAAGPVTPLVSSGLAQAQGLAVDGAGNVYIADTGHNAIKRWTVANNTVTPLVSSNLSLPQSVAVDGAGNVYIADSGNNAIKEWMAANSNVTTLVSSGLSEPAGVAVDGAGNVYIADTYHNAIKQWTAAKNTVATLVSSGLSRPFDVAVDGAGNVYIADTYDSAIKEWMAANSNVTTLVSSGLSRPYGVAVDGAGNVYIADSNHNAIKELPYAFVDPTPKLEPLAAGNDALPVVLPTTENLLPPFAPTSSQSWLTIGAITNGVVRFSFTANSGPARTANITLLGQSIPITQGVIGTPPTLTVAQELGNGVLQFSFTNNPSGIFTVLSATNLSLPLNNWRVVGSASNMGAGQFQFTVQPPFNAPQSFYTVRSP
jgi:sugar lactone lactonase YvrE